MGKHITVIFLVALLSGCANPIPSDVRREAQPLTYTQVAANPKTTAGTTVIWGGRIIDTFNRTNGGEIYVLLLPLDRKGKPSDNDSASEGRFIVVNTGFLDPGTYSRGRLITVAGQLDGVRNERLQNVLFRYPVLDSLQIHLWASGKKEVNNYYYGANRELYWGYYPLWWDGGVGWYYPGSYGESNGEDTRSGGAHH